MGCCEGASQKSSRPQTPCHVNGALAYYLLKGSIMKITASGNDKFRGFHNRQILYSGKIGELYSISGP